MPGVIGLTLAKINGTFELDVKNSRWNGARPVVQHHTGGGVKSAVGQQAGTFGFDEVIPKQGATNWQALKDFSIEIFDKETRTIVVFSATGSNWNNIAGNSDSSSAVTGKNISGVCDNILKL